MMTKSKKNLKVKKSIKNTKSSLLKKHNKKSIKRKSKGGSSCAIKPGLDPTPCFYIDAWKQYKQPCRFLPLDGPNQLTNIYPEDWNGNLHPK